MIADDRRVADYITRAFLACKPNKHCPFGNPQEIADWNADERARFAKTPYGRHIGRIIQFNASSGTDKLSGAEFDSALNSFGADSYAKYMAETAKQQTQG